MKPEELIDRLYQTHELLPMQTRLHYAEIASTIIDNQVIFYPDGSRSFGDLFSSIIIITGKGSPIMSVFGSFLFFHSRGRTEIPFEDGYMTPPHKNNQIELNYIMEGEFRKHIEGKDYVFHKGEFFLINQNINNGEYLYSRDMAVITLQISNAFFNKTMNHEDIALSGKDAEEFYNRFIAKGRGEYYFIRFTPKEHSSQVPELFIRIIGELIEPAAGGAYMVMGYTDRLLSLLPLEYQVGVEWSGRKNEENKLFEKIRFLLEDCLEDVSMRDLVSAFGHNADYFNRLIKRYRGMTYSAFLQNIRLEKAELFLRTTEYTVEEIARKVGYKNISFFYRIFTERFHISPGEMRKILCNDKKSN